MGERSAPDEPSRDPRVYRIDGREFAARPLSAGLYLVATPIGNLGDVTLRALETLAAADLVACEDTRVTARLLERYGIRTALTPYHDHNAAAARPKILARIRDGGAVALVSDAGTPLVSDPGYRLVRAAQDEGLAVTTVPGASAVLAALAVAGLPTDRFFFEGFLPPKDGARRTRIAALARIPATLILYESGPRIGRALHALSEGLGPRQAAVCRELTKLHEEVRRGDLSALAQAYDANAKDTDKDLAEIRGEFAIVIAPPADEADAADADTVDALLRRALRHASVKDAVGDVAAATGRPRREIYQRALALSDDQESEDGAER
jgi:16S rRNA (cytidine1402-2'-O)-methyltransferase